MHEAEELEDGMLRMPIRPPTDAEAEAAWVTLDATRCGGRLVFKAEKPRRFWGILGGNGGELWETSGIV